MNIFKSLGLFAVTCVVAAPAVEAADTIVPLDPRATYLHVCNDAALNAPALSLAGLGIVPGQTLLIEVLGNWDCGGPCSDTGTGTIAVFSGSSTLLAGSQSHRVPDAIAAGAPVTTGNTYWCNTPTDIAEDCLVSPSANVVVPQGATHLFIGASDILFDDNTDPNANYAVRITLVTLPVANTTWGKVKSLYAPK